jgi:4-hydroxybenzoate polyprenyltransferase
VSPVLIARFLRADTLGASITMVLLGAATAAQQLSVTLVPGLITVALSFHIYAYLLNDVVDLPLDRTDPRRSGSPLVTGLVSPRTALALAMIQIPILVVLVMWLDPAVTSLVALTVLIAAVSVYDLWGKRFPVPPVTDLIQGVAWAALGWLAADLVGETTGWTVVLAVYFLMFILLANGVHGSIRDLANDRRHGARTTATWFGARFGPGGEVRVEGAYLAYALGLQVLTVALAFVPTVLGWEQPGWLRPIAIAVAGASSTRFLVMATRAADRHRQLVLGAWHLILVLASVFLMLATRLPGWALVAAIGCYVLPFASYRWLFRPRPQPGTHWTVDSAPTR